ncbi:MAG TPA: hypothetical protein PK971_04445 [Saprospiraceae bacterium]|nr:hypothetical protein [Saprospiraceae bacterium]
MRLSVREGSAVGNSVYCSLYETKTNDFGAFNVQLNRNAVLCSNSPAFETVAWESGSKWVQVEYRFGIGAYTDLGATEIASSFYAFAARSAEKVTYISPENAEEGFVLAYDAVAKIWKPKQLVLNGISIINGGPGIAAVQSGNTVTVTNTGDTEPTDDLTKTSVANGDVSGNFSTLSVDRIKGRAVSPSAPATGQVLKWNGSEWTPQTDETGGSGGGNDNWGTQVVQTTGLALSGNGTPASPLTLASQGAAIGQVLKWDGNNWKPQNDQSGGGGQTTVSVNPDGLSIAGDPAQGYTITLTGDRNPNDDLTTSSTAGGDITGPFSNLQIVPGSVTSSDIANGAVNAEDLASMNANFNQVLKWNGAAWIPQDDSDAQSLVLNGLQLSITGSGSSITLPVGNTYSEGQGIDITPSNVISIDNTVITTSTFAGGDVTGTYNSLQIAPNSVGTNEILNGSIKKEDLDPSINLGGGSGQWSQNGSALYYNNGGVGIGTNTPVAPLNVVAMGSGSTGVVSSVFQANGANGSGGTGGETNIGVLGTYNPDAYGTAVAGIGYNGFLPPFEDTDIGVYGSGTNGVVGVGVTGATGTGTAIRGIAGTNALAGFFSGEVQDVGVFSILQPSANTLLRKVVLGANTTGDGYSLLLDANGNRNVLLSGLTNSPNAGAVGVFGPSPSQTSASALVFSDVLGTGQINLNSSSGTKVGGGVAPTGQGIWVVNGPNGQPNVYLGNDAANLNHGLAGVVTSTGSMRAGMSILSSGQGYLFSDVVSAQVKDFRMVHPNDPSKEIWYACVEGPEVAAYDRGTAQLSGGIATVRFSEHFQAVADYLSMTVMLTPLSADSKGMAVIEKTKEGFQVKELLGGRGNYAFDWEVKCIRKGYEDFKAVRPREPYPSEYTLPKLTEGNINLPEMPTTPAPDFGSKSTTPKRKN